ncbi:conserved hypothetical protein [Leishmania major strain Friedlin]|uniref:Adenylate cyclase n=1 Tax=Leishmania major TaxID=5664 RepID=Q4Q380_LEIMA|nr:conserved hypothetical protein [Leishmania major strain Friedlin]CAG9581966.1 hypothetical_protein_-_conserved [Leishmania major strain Friedlin]CAJ07832.1 conserved hypothetical protein [Leishmania major strain Friedlin]|eukprot:XP_001686218.1 conserved hypothetical protein [Leishmania major strain Friedlin]
MEGFAVMSDAAADARMKEKDTHLANLIIEKRAAAKEIEGLKAEIADLRAQLQRATSRGLLPYAEGLSPTLAEEKTAPNNAPIEEISIWNEELIHTVEQLQRSLIQLEANSKAQLITLTDRLNQMREENERLLRENDSLKARIGDDVLRQRQTNRIEVAFERSRIAARVRAAGLQRLEAAEANLMEAHDDVYHVQRWDAMLLPQRDVSFVFHFVSNVTYPLGDVEELIMKVYQQFLFHSSSCCRGYRVGFYKSMEVFVFQAPSDALLFAKECHEQLVRLSWFSCIENMPSFSTITENNKVLYKGPRIHTCIFTCSPESYVDPVSGKYAFFGPEVVEAVQAAIEQCPIGEIVVNEKWSQLMCMQSRMREDRSALTESNVAELRECLGPMWNVVGLPGAHHIIASILPSGLRGRRGVEASVLYPSRKYPCLEMKDSASVVCMVVNRMKGMLPDTFEAPEEGRQKSNGGDDVILQQMRRRPNFWHDAVAKAPLHTSTQQPSTEFSDSAAKLLELFVVQKENSNLVTLYRKAEAVSAVLERNIMESEDRFEIRKHKTLHPSETAYICTIDTGDESIWKRLLLKSISDEQFESIQNTIRGDVHNAAKVHFGFLMSGNYSDVFTYVFREVEQALAFVSEMYIKVNRTGTKYAHTSLGKGRDIFLFRAGVVSGSMTSIYRNLENGVLKCTGPAIRLSGTLCDLAESGEILAMEDVIRSFYSKKENLLDTQYTVKQRPQFIGSHDAPAVVHSILPKPFAYRHKQLRSFGKAAVQNKNLYLPYRSVLAALTLRRDELPRQGVLDMMEQQQRRLEFGEMARMSAEDNYERGWQVSTATTSPLRSPWLLLCQPQAEEQSENVPARRRSVRFRTMEEVDAGLMYVRRSTKPRAFLYCDVAGAGAITRSVAPPLLTLVWAHYNYIVQSAVRNFSGYVAKTNSTTSYLVVFEEPTMALEAARQIQLEMVESMWPEELRVLESTLHVKDIKSRTVLFNGPRPQIAVHVSDQYTWCFISPSSSPAALRSDASSKAKSEDGADGGSATAEPLSVVHISGVGVDETFVLGLHAHGGEIRLSRSLLNAVGAHPSGKLLLAQLKMELVVTPSVIHSVEGTKEKSSTTTAEAQKTQGNSEPKAVKANVFAEECVAAVPRRLEGRLALILPSTSTAFGAAKRTEAALAMATASATEDNAESTSGEDDGAVSADDTGKLESVTPAAVTTETTGLASATLPRAIVLPAAMMAQHAWLVEPEESFNPLPAALHSDWSTVTLQPANGLKDLGFLEETSRIQTALQELLKMFPSAQLLAQAVEGVSDESASELPAEHQADSSTNAAAGGAAGKKTSTENRSSTKIPAPPTVMSAARGSVNLTRRSKDAALSKACATSSAARVATRAAAVRQYALFMDFSKYLITVLLNALEIGADQRSPPALPLPHCGQSSKITAVGPPPISSDSGPSGPPGGSAGSASQKNSRSAVSGRVHGTSFRAIECSSSGSARESCVSSLPGIPPPNGRLLNKSPAGARASLTPSPLSRDAEPQERGASDSLCEGFKVSSERPFLSALDYLDGACRTLAQLSGTELGKLAKIPAAPLSKSKAFPFRSNSARRH